MKCPHCQGSMKRSSTLFHVDRKGCHLTLDKVPAWVCTQCGEAMFDSPQVDAIQELVRSVEQRAEALAVMA